MGLYECFETLLRDLDGLVLRGLPDLRIVHIGTVEEIRLPLEAPVLAALAQRQHHITAARVSRKAVV